MKWNMQWKVWKLKEKQRKIKNNVKELKQRTCGVHLKMGFWRLVKNFVKRKNQGGNEEAHGGRMRKCKKQQREKNAL